MTINSAEEQIDRRGFLKRMLKLMFLMISVFFIVLVLIILKPTRARKRSFKFFEVSEDKIPKEGVRKVDIKIDEERNFKVFIIRTNQDSIIALSPICSHLGCFVYFDKNSNEFICPCHGGRYDPEGKVLAGPPKEPLQKLPIKIENKRVFVGIRI